MDIIVNILDDMCPIRNRKVKDRNEPWITDEILDIIHEKNRAWKKAKKTQKMKILKLQECCEIESNL